MDKRAIETVVQEFKVGMEIISYGQFVPLPSAAFERHQIFGEFGQLKVLIFDPYSIALSKLARGFETDIQDVLFLLRSEIIMFDKLTEFVNDALPQAWDYDIDPDEMKRHLEVVKQLFS